MSENKKRDWHEVKKQSELEEAGLEKPTFEDDDEDGKQAASEQPPHSALDFPSHKELEEKLTLAEQKSHENWEKAVRAMAELENVRRAAERDINKAHRFGLEKLINALLPVIDSLEQALQIAEKDGQASMVEGLQLTMSLFLDALEKQGVTQLNPEGAVFNPQEHEAMSIQELPSVADNTITVVLQKGYLLNERLIRPARVIVAKAKA